MRFGMAGNQDTIRTAIELNMNELPGLESQRQILIQAIAKAWVSNPVATEEYLTKNIGFNPGNLLAFRRVFEE